MSLRQSLFVAACLAAFTVPAFADTTVTILHVVRQRQHGLALGTR